MNYEIGTTLTLWKAELSFSRRVLEITHSVLVTVVHVELRGTATPALIAEDAAKSVYKKNWNRDQFLRKKLLSYEWESRLLPYGLSCPWIPLEAVGLYNFVAQLQECKKFRICDRNGRSVLPRGSVQYCGEHDFYYYAGNHCPACQM